MTKVTVEKKGIIEIVPKCGDLVIAKNGEVVMVHEWDCYGSHQFKGVVIVTGDACSIFGEHSKFLKTAFTPFIGKIILESE